MLATFKKLSDEDVIRYQSEKKQSGTKLLDLLPRGKSRCVVSTGRSALAHLIARLGLTAQDEVLLPAYSAEGVMKPFLASSCKIRFYKLTPNLTPDLDYLKELLEKHPQVKLMVLVHPFGFESPLEPIRELLKNKGVRILEDCAQGLFSCYKDGRAFGTGGDFALFSFNKFLPVPDGALLVSNVQEVDVGLAPNQLQPNDAEAMGHYLEFLKTNYQLSLTHTAEGAKPLLEDLKNAYDRYYARVNSNLVPACQSRFSETVQNATDYPAFSELRKRNIRFLYEHLKNPQLKFLNPVYRDEFPLAVPLLVSRGKRDAYLQDMMSHDVLLMTLVKRWDFIPPGQEQVFTNERYFLDNHILLRIDESASSADMSRLVDMLNRPF